jgi:hypothetical protein
MMNYIRSWCVAVFFIFFSLGVSAADVPADAEGAQDLEQASCIDQATQDCINNACLTSEDVNCEGNCGTLAQQKCQDQQNE